MTGESVNTTSCNWDARISTGKFRMVPFLHTQSTNLWMHMHALLLSLDLRFKSVQRGPSPEVNQKCAVKDRLMEEPAFSLAEGNREETASLMQPTLLQSCSFYLPPPPHLSSYKMPGKTLQPKLFRELTGYCSFCISAANLRSEACNKSTKHRQQQFKSTGAITE